MNEMYLCINRNARPNKNQLITTNVSVTYQEYLQYPVDNTYNKAVYIFYWGWGNWSDKCAKNA